MPDLDLNGVLIRPQTLDRSAQVQLVEVLRAVATAAPPYAPDTPYGKPMSVRMTSAGRFGWYSDRTGYRYVDRHPSGMPWPAIPPQVLDLWEQVTGLTRTPDCCLVNFYGEGARMGLHQDKDEADFSWPVLSISLGDEGLFRVGGTRRSDPTRSIWLKSGDVALLGGAARLAYHGVDRIRFGSSDLLPRGGRINLTLRVVT
ncbi:alpha-ketoglutarate-dependent dioxygenase AlkB family protein [Seohaeicola zhoushanensis]|uniref:Alpha-ketoglutarate-dependent dioxygenase AlkB n=1 Tax=Seohaeicola zhoushanensis TaxID=1569283 RepID=A0A8J3M3J1_9RHOB|nr:alpha-ketoglutarate-dependent dioxygenase AlkB [Seohaeicola zhoushanensis]GHF33935.1 alpha-ketoglutarate-dependent dioxygenase AlkB [Seohaeicola zhoushanensis]